MDLSRQNIPGAKQSIFIIAANHVQVQRFCNEHRASLPPDARIVPVMTDRDMRGRRVESGDVAVVYGPWTLPPSQTAWLVEAFNHARVSDDVGTPLLKYHIGEPPEVTYRTHFRRESQPDVVINHHARQAGKNSQFFGIELTQEGAPEPDHEMDLNKELMQALAKEQQGVIAALNDEVKALREWLSGVVPVEDPEIPGIFWCAVCGKRIPTHADGCPAAPALPDPDNPQ